MKSATEISNEIEKYLPVVMREARKLSGNDLFTREDLTQEGIMAALRAMDSYDPARGSLEGYVRTCARNRMISYLRRSWHEYAVDDDILDARVSGSIASNGGFGEPEERIEINESLSKLIEELSAFEKNVLYAYLSEGSLSGAALLLDCERKKADNALQRIRNKARAM
ncbi:MAG: sigma-70 family RNA polymerase sigma factor [Synergistaceae bacterium]|jgi:RNA polymerase sporulation-specific sigma factor|nr:sigma-70 family RNA polymerase sigma factor [Synergistaceae bacterium]